MTSHFAVLAGIMSCLLLGITLMHPLMASGDEFVGPLPLPPPADTKNVFDTPRDYMSDKFVDFISGIDRFFGTDRNYQEANDSVMQINIYRVMGYGGERKFAWSANANVRLPMAEQKLHLVLETDPDKNVLVDPTQTLSPPLKQPSTPQSYAAALRYEKAEAERWRFRTDGGIKFSGIHSSPFVRARTDIDVLMDSWRVRFSETVFWFNSIGAGSATQLDLDHPVSPPVLFRSTTNATWLDDSQTYFFRQDFSFIHKLDDRNAFLYQATVLGENRPQTQVTDYVLLALFRHRLHREWMFLEVSPQLHFPRARDFRISPVLSLQLEILFDKSR